MQTSSSNSSYLYVDGESHFIRSQEAWKQIHGDQALLEQLRYKGESDSRLILVQPRAKVFWTRKMNPSVKRAVYVTAMSGDPSARASAHFHDDPAEFAAFRLTG
ncbi:hypothetical protein [Paludisphaera borealis]|uniref:Uncharacterized protein n=1 Tax=Paludisphaera borealis TaxID=1387353 RepID=A0A1U7CWA0_9BACT|nr:hypothetical protein [Paludisphaera borealis]APW63201.1 hypothetical protein BSF38_04765 [Paludisphaera borealis]